MKFNLFLINLMLLLLAVAIGYWVFEAKPIVAADQTLPIVDLSDKIDNAKTTLTMVPSRRLGDLSILSDRTLFRPERNETFEVPGDEEVHAASDRPDDVSMELIGIGSVGKKRAAVILIQERRRRRSKRSRKDKQKSDSALNAVQHVYQVDDEVEDTGFIVEEITSTQVRLMRDNEEKILELATGDDASKRRVKKAMIDKRRKERQHEAARKRDEDKNKKHEASSPPPPPPPPPMPGGGPTPKKSPGDNASDDSEAARREKMKERLRELVKRRKERAKERGED